MNPVLLLDRDMEAPELYDLGGGTAAVFSSRRPEREGPNEDTAGLFRAGPQEGVLAVADGAGGLPGGHRAAVLALQVLEEEVRRPRNGESLRTHILDAFDRANREILGLGIGAATTLAVVELAQGALRCYHAGDSALLVTGQRGRVKLQTVSHSPVSYAVESGMLTESAALHHEDRNVVSNFVGSESMRIDVGPVLRLAPRDTVLLGTDGVFDNVHIGEAVECVRRGKLDAAARKLAELCRRRMSEPTSRQPCKPDDLTFVAFRMASPRAPAGDVPGED